MATIVRDEVTGRSVNLDKLTRSEIRDLKKYYIKYNQRTLKLKPKDAKRWANIEIRVLKEVYGKEE